MRDWKVVYQDGTEVIVRAFSRDDALKAANRQTGKNEGATITSMPMKRHGFGPPS